MKPLTICKDMTNKLLIDWLQKKRKVLNAAEVFEVLIHFVIQSQEIFERNLKVFDKVFRI